MLVGIEQPCPFPILDRDRQDLRRKAPFLLRARGPVVALDGQTILFLASDGMICGHIFGGHAHVEAFEGIAQDRNERIDHFDVAHLLPETGCGDMVRGTGHGLRATGDREIAFVQRQHLRGGDDRLDARTA